jgi:hypothetical protein
MIKKPTFIIIILFFSVNCFSQYFDQVIGVTSTNCCTVQSVGMGFFNVDKEGNRYSMSSVATQGYPPHGYFGCSQSSGASWGVNFFNSYDTWFIDAIPDNLGNTICSGYTTPLFYFNAAHTISYQNGNFYVKYDSLGNPLWAVPRYGSSPAADKAGGFISVGGGTIYKYNPDGNIIWQKPGDGAYTTTSFDNEYFYLLGTSLSKCDTAGNIIWTSGSYAGSNKLLVDSLENIYIRSGSSIHKLDSAGNFIFSRSYSGMVDYSIDKEGNIYVLLDMDVKKYDTTGLNLLWSYHSTTDVDNKKISVDKNFRVYFVYYYSDYTTNFQPNPIFQPPTFYHNPGGLHSYLSYMGARISQDSASALNSITTGSMPLNSLQNSCTGNTFNCYFTINSFPINPPFNPLFKVQLSDSSGSFTNAVVIGNGNYSPISCTIPASVIPGNNYRMRVVLKDVSLAGSLNTNGSFKIRTSPPASFSVTNYTHYQYGTYYGCATGTPIQLNAPTISNCKYQWNKLISPIQGYSAISGATNTLYTTPAVILNTSYYALFVTDTTVGCTGISGLDTVYYPNPESPVINNLPAEVCLNNTPISLNAWPSGGVFSGSGIYGSLFYPDSAGIGLQNITYTFNSWVCGIVDTVQSITVNPLPSAAISTNSPTTFCSGDSVILNAPYHSNRLYQWKKGGIDIAGATASSYTASVGGIYKVTVINTITGCSKTTISGAAVTVTPLPNAIITPQGPTTFCAGNSVVLKANTGAGLKYHWKKDGAFISGAIGINYTVFVAGTYKVQVTNNNGCKKISMGTVVVIPCREEENLNEINSDLSIFPNPTSGKFTIQSPTEKISQITITSVSGQIIYRKELPGSPLGVRGYEIDLTNQSKGIYLVQVITDKEVYNHKIVLN